jgi:phospholipase/carboxylesterase
MALLPCVEIEPRLPATASVVWLHGLGASGDDFVPIVPMLRLPHVRFVFPQAPDRRVTINGGYVMPSWYDITSLGFRGQEREDLGQLAESSAAVEALIAREASRGVPATRVVLAGFSQGGAVALHVGHRPGQALAGIMALSTYLVHGDAERVRGVVETPLLCMHGRHDDVVPYEQGRLAYDACAHPGRPAEWRDYPMGHELCDAQLVDIARWLQERVGSSAP